MENSILRTLKNFSLMERQIPIRQTVKKILLMFVKKIFMKF